MERLFGGHNSENCSGCCEIFNYAFAPFRRRFNHRWRLGDKGIFAFLQRFAGFPHDRYRLLTVFNFGRVRHGSRGLVSAFGVFPTTLAGEWRGVIPPGISCLVFWTFHYSLPASSHALIFLLMVSMIAFFDSSSSGRFGGMASDLG